MSNQKKVKNVKKVTPNQTINDAAEKKFINKRNILFISIGIVITLIILFLTAKFIIDIDFAQLGASMHEGFMHNIGYLWFSLLIIFMISQFAANSLAIVPRLKSLGIQVPVWEWILMSITISFIKAVTPANFVSDPYTLFWLKTHGCPTSKATSFLFTNTFLWQLAQLVITAPSFIYLAVRWESIVYFSNGSLDAQGLSVFILMCCGFSFDIIGLTFMYFMCTSKRLHYFLSKVFNWFKKKLHMQYHTKAQIAEKYKQRAVIKQDFYDYMRDWKNTLLILFIWLFAEIISYSAVSWALNFVQYVDGKQYTINFWVAFNCANLTFTANKINLLPGGEGGIQWILRVLIGSISNTKNNSSSTNKYDIVIKNGVIIWDAFRNIFPGAIGIFGMVALTINQVKTIKKKGM